MTKPNRPKPAFDIKPATFRPLMTSSSQMRKNRDDMKRLAEANGCGTDERIFIMPADLFRAAAFISSGPSDDATLYAAYLDDSASVPSAYGLGVPFDPKDYGGMLRAARKTVRRLWEDLFRAAFPSGTSLYQFMQDMWRAKAADSRDRDYLVVFMDSRSGRPHLRVSTELAKASLDRLAEQLESAASRLIGEPASFVPFTCHVKYALANDGSAREALAAQRRIDDILLALQPDAAAP